MPVLGTFFRRAFIRSSSGLRHKKTPVMTIGVFLLAVLVVLLRLDDDA